MIDNATQADAALVAAIARQAADDAELLRVLMEAGVDRRAWKAILEAEAN